MFVGIARTSEVTGYLRDSAHAVVTDVSYSPFHADYRALSGVRAGAEVPILPAIGWGGLGGGLALLIVAGGLVFVGVQTPRGRAGDPETVELTPAPAA